MVGGNGLSTMNFIPETMDFAMPVNTIPTIGHVMSMNNMTGENNGTKGCIDSRVAERTINEKLVTSHGTTTLKPSRNTIIIIDDKADHNYEHN